MGADPALKIEPAPTSQPSIRTRHDTAVESVRDLIVDTLQGSKQSRFAVAERLCRLGRELAMLGPAKKPPRVRDFDDEDKASEDGDEDVADEGGQFNIYNGHGIMLKGGRRAHPLTDRDQLMHDMLMTVGPHMQAITEQKKAEIARQEAEEFLVLQKIMATTGIGDDHTVIAQRMQRIKENMEARNAVVSSDDARGHPARKSEQEPDDPEGVGADSDRGESLGQVAFVCRADPLDEGAMG